MADEEEKSKASEDKPKDAKGKKKDAESEEEAEPKQQPQGPSTKLLIISGIASLVIFIGVFSYMMGVFDPPPPLAEGEEGYTEEEAPDTLFESASPYHSDYGRAAAAADAVLDSGVLDTAFELSEIERARQKLASDETRIAKERRELVALKQEVERLLSKKDAIADEKILYTAKLLGGMKPEETAKLFAELENKLILKILPKMKPQSASKLMAQLPPKRAAAITTELLQSDP